MADKWIAQGTIQYGTSDKGVVTFYPGDTVTGLADDEMEKLVEAGAVVKQSDLDRRPAPGEASDMEKEYAATLQAKDDKIADLEKRIAELEAGSNKTPAGSGTQAGSGSGTAAKTTK